MYHLWYLWPFTTDKLWTWAVCTLTLLSFSSRVFHFMDFNPEEVKISNISHYKWKYWTNVIKCHLSTTVFLLSPFFFLGILSGVTFLSSPPVSPLKMSVSIYNKRTINTIAACVVRQHTVWLKSHQKKKKIKTHLLAGSQSSLAETSLAETMLYTLVFPNTVCVIMKLPLKHVHITECRKVGTFFVFFILFSEYICAHHKYIRFSL